MADNPGRSQLGVRAAPLVPFSDDDDATGYAATVDPCVVEASALAEVVREAAVCRAGLGYDDRGSELTMPQLAQRLAARTRDADPQGRGVPFRTVHNILAGKRQTTELRTADALLGAVGRFDALYSLEVRGNPAASASRRALCCGSSLTGTGRAA